MNFIQSDIYTKNRQLQLYISEIEDSVFTEIVTSPAGDLHILPQGGDGPNAVAIGFLPDNCSRIS